jgi:protein TonB
VDLTQVFAEAVVDEVPERISCPLPEYPRMMQQANIEGQVLLQFVVETDGHVTSGSIETLSSSHRAFEGPAREMIARCLFRPGRVRASPVRVLVQMPILFTLAGRR